MNGQAPYGNAPQPAQGLPQYSAQPQPGYPAPGQMPQGQLARPPAVRMNGALYITFYIICTLVGGVLVAAGSNRATQEVIPAIPLPFLVLAILQLVFMYKMYKALDDGVTRPTPGLAVGLMFIPLFSIVWFFIVWGKFPGQYNQFIQRHGIRAQPLGLGLYVCALVLGFFPIVGLVLWSIVFGKTAGAVNALSRQ
jgi:hypothetical protein